MSELTLVYWVFLDSSLLFLIYLGARKIPFLKLRYGFLALLVATGFYLNLLFLKWFTALGDSEPLLLTRLIFTSGILIHIGFGLFATAFADQTSLWKKSVFRGVQGILLLLAAAGVFSGLIIE